MKARSRLKSGDKSSPDHKPARHPTGQTSKFGTRMTHLPTLILGLLFYLGVYVMLTKIHPADIKNFIIPNTYGPFQLLLLLGNFFFWSFLFLNSRRGLLVSLWLGLMVFFKLQSVVINWQLILITLIPFAIIELVSHANFFQKTHPSHTTRNSR